MREKGAWVPAGRLLEIPTKGLIAEERGFAPQHHLQRREMGLESKTGFNHSGLRDTNINRKYPLSSRDSVPSSPQGPYVQAENSLPPYSKAEGSDTYGVFLHKFRASFTHPPISTAIHKSSPFMQKPKTNRTCHCCLTRGGMGWCDGQHWRSRGVRKEKKSWFRRNSVKINVIFAEEREKMEDARLPYWRTFPGM